MNYWWMNTNPRSWNIFRKMSEGEVEPWTARGEKGKYKRYMRWVQPGDLGLCYQTHGASKLVAQLEAVSGLRKWRGEEVVRFRLVRFLKPPVPWFTVETTKVIAPKHLKMIRRGTLFPLSKLQYTKLTGLSGIAGTREVVTQDLAALKTEEGRLEGALKSRFVNYHERLAEKRVEAIEHHRTVCQVCGFDFKRIYGDRGAGFIEVHHLRPISTLKKATNVDPKSDMAVVCANCHRMIHRKRDHVLSLRELKKLLNPAFAQLLQRLEGK
jgi:hypothetical protein